MNGADASVVADGEFIENLPFSVDAGTGASAKVGLIVLASDYTMEHEFAQIFAAAAEVEPGTNFYVARIENAPHITPQTLADMKQRIPATVKLLLPGEDLDVIAYGCTSASVVLGEQSVFSQIALAQPDAHSTTPITSAFAAFEAFGAKRVGVLTPYRRDVNQLLKDYIEAAGYRVPVFASFNEEHDPVVARIDAASLGNAVEHLSDKHELDLVFVSCTSIRLLSIAPSLEARLGIPVISSNLAMGWHCLRLAGVQASLSGLGRLYQLPLAAPAG